MVVVASGAAFAAYDVAFVVASVVWTCPIGDPFEAVEVVGFEIVVLAVVKSVGAVARVG